MSLLELYEEYSRRLEEYTQLRCDGRNPTVEEVREAEAEADEWLRQHHDKQTQFKL